MNQLRSSIGAHLKRHRALLVPIAVAAMLRFGLMVAAYLLTGTQVMTQGDTASYLAPGANLIFHGTFASVIGGLPEIDRTPGYPIFAMLSGMAFNHVLLTVVCQILISLISLTLIWRIANRSFPNTNAGMIAAWFYAVEPVSILYTVRLMPETLFVLLLLAMIDRLLSFHSTGRLSAICESGIALAAATYVRPASYYLVFALAAELAVMASRHRGYWWKAPAVLLATVLPLQALWQARNWIETGYDGYSSIVEKNLYFFQSAEVTAELQHNSLGDEQKKIGYPDEAAYLAVHPEQQHWSPAERLRFMRIQSLQIIAQHRGLYFGTHLRGVAVVAFTPCATELLQLLRLYPKDNEMPRRILNQGIFKSMGLIVSTHPAIAAFMALWEAFLLTLYGLAIRGILNPNKDRIAISILGGIALYFLLISGGAQAVGRYRLPVIPGLCILAAGGLASLQNKTRDRFDPA